MCSIRRGSSVVGLLRLFFRAVHIKTTHVRPCRILVDVHTVGVRGMIRVRTALSIEAVHFWGCVACEGVFVHMHTYTYINAYTCTPTCTYTYIHIPTHYAHMRKHTSTNRVVS